MGFGGRLQELAKQKGRSGQTARDLGIDTTAGQRANTPPPPKAPADAPQPAPPEVPPTEEPQRTRPEGLGPPVDAELQNALGRMLSGVDQSMQTERLKRLGKPGSQRQQFFNMYGHAPTSTEIGAWNLTLRLERALGRKPTIQEVKRGLREADFIDRSTEPFA